MCDYCQTNYLNIYQTDLHEICRFARTMVAVDKRPGSNFFDPLRDDAMATNFRYNPHARSPKRHRHLEKGE